MELTNSATINDVSLSIENVSQDQLEKLITKVKNVSSWCIEDRNRVLVLQPLRNFQKQLKVRIDIIDDQKLVQGVDEVAYGKLH